jgi:GT2 family glycosyltransferase
VGDHGGQHYISVPIMPSICICICTRDRPAELAETLASLARSTLRPARVVVSDDGADPATRAVCDAAPLAVEHVAGPRRGLCANRNAAVARAAEDVVLFLDDDCLLGEDFLDRALACMAEHEARLGRGRVIVSGAERNRGRVVHASAPTFLGFQARPYRAGEPMRSIVINATLFPRSLFETVRFDEQIVYGYDEIDLTARAVAAGWTVVPCEEAVNDHRPSARGRDAYAAVLVGTRLYVTYKRYRLIDGRPLRAGVFALAGAAHAVAAGARRGGVRGAREGVAATRLARRYWSVRQAD